MKKLNNKMERRGVSPVIATVFLVGLVLVIASIVSLWMWNFTEERVTKFDKNVQLVCDDIKFSAIYSSGGELQISNDGNVPIYKMKIEIFDEAGHNTEDLDNEYSSDWPENGLNPGAGFSELMEFGNANKIILIPVLYGIGEAGKKEYTCNEVYGVEISL